MNLYDIREMDEDEFYDMARRIINSRSIIIPDEVTIRIHEDMYAYADSLNAKSAYEIMKAKKKFIDDHQLYVLNDEDSNSIIGFDILCEHAFRKALRESNFNDGFDEEYKCKYCLVKEWSKNLDGCSKNSGLEITAFSPPSILKNIFKSKKEE